MIIVQGSIAYETANCSDATTPDVHVKKEYEKYLVFVYTSASKCHKVFDDVCMTSNHQKEKISLLN